jgi:transposase
MTAKTKRMGTIKQLLQMHEQGLKYKNIARRLQMSKNTVKSYLRKVSKSGVDIKALMELDDPVLEGWFHAGTAAYPDNRFEDFKNKLDYLISELTRPHVTKRLLWEEYRQGFPNGYMYTQFCFHLAQQMSARNPSMVLTHKPGEKLFVDFAGDKLPFTDRETGEIIWCQVFVACLPYSDYSFALAVLHQTIEDFLYALTCCLQEIGGVPQLLVPDNLKAAVIKANRYEPDINRALEDFANHYWFTVIPTRIKRPRDKALAENQVRLIYNRVYAKLRNQQFFDLESLNQAIREKNREHTQTRMQQKPFTREELFLAEEKSTLGPLPLTPFELKYYRESKVAHNNHIYLAQDKHYYSVPYTYTGSKVKVIYTRTMVYIYSKGEQIALHLRDYRPGGYTTNPEHLCSHHQHYLQRSPAYYIRKAEEKSEVLSRLVQLMFDDGRHPEVHYRSCDGLMNLSRKTDPSVFEKACQIAIDNQGYSYKFVRTIIENKMTGEEPQSEIEKPLPPHINVRGKEYYSQTTINF